jgi:hypothetical protein
VAEGETAKKLKKYLHWEYKIFILVFCNLIVPTRHIREVCSRASLYVTFCIA